MRRESHTPHPRGGRGLMPRAAVAGMTMMALLGAFTGGLVWAADPDFSNVSDILGGKKYLLRQDDLVFTSTQVGTSQHQTAMATLYSANSTLAFRQTVPWGVAGGGVNYAQGNSRTAVGRMFNLPNDVVATFTQPDNVNPTGVNVYDPGTGTVSFSRLPYNSFQPVDSTDAAVLADFTGDGYADLVTLATSLAMFGGAAITVATAADLANVGAGLIFGAPTVVTPNPQPFAGGSPIAVGDFNGDGIPEIALVTCPQPGCSVQIFAVDRNTLAVSMKSSITLPGLTSGTASGLLGGGPLRRHGPRPTRGLVPARLGQRDRGHDRFRCTATTEPQGDIAGHHRVRRILFCQGGSPGLVLALRLRRARGRQ